MQQEKYERVACAPTLTRLVRPTKILASSFEKPRLACQRGVFRYGGRAEPSVIRYNRKFSSA